METKFVEIPVSEARPGDWVVLKAGHWSSEVRAEVYETAGCLAAGWVVRYGDGDAGPLAVRFEREVPALPTVPGATFRATVRDVPDVPLMVCWDGQLVSAYSVMGHLWHREGDIDLSTVRVGRVVFDD